MSLCCQHAHLPVLQNTHSNVTGSTLPSLIDMIVKLYALHQPLVSRHSSEVLAAVAGSSSSSHLGTAQLAQLLGMLIDGEASHALSGACEDMSLECKCFIGLTFVTVAHAQEPPDTHTEPQREHKDTFQMTDTQLTQALCPCFYPHTGSSAASAGGGDQVSAMARLLEGGLLRLAESEAPADAAAAARLLPRVVHLMVPLVSGCGLQDLELLWLCCCVVAAGAWQA